MKKYQRENRSHFAGALICVLISTVFAVLLQFIKGNVLDCAVAGQTVRAVQYALALGAFILGECFAWYGYRRCSARFVTGCIIERIEVSFINNLCRATKWRGEWRKK